VAAPLVARVLIDSPLPQLDRLFDYAIPAELVDTAVPGVRVRVPLRSAGRTADGYIVELGPPGDYTGTLSELDEVVSPIPVLTPAVWKLARRASERAAGTASDIVRLAVPHRQVRVEKAYLAAEERALIPDLPQPRPIAGYPDGAIEAAIANAGRLAVDALPGVAQAGNGSWVGRWAVTMAAAAASTLSAGKSAILAVADYRDQEQLEAALTDVLPPELVVRLDARQSNPDRYRGFLRCLSGGPLAIIGNRSVVYAPAERLGLIALFDDGDPLHAEPLAPYVHSRDAALLRQEHEGCALIVLGHSRSTEVERLVEIGWMSSLSPAPVVLPRVIPTAQQQSSDRLAAQARIPSSAWQEAKAALEHGPVLVQVARPGYAPRLACADCRQSARCTTCGGPLGQKTARSVPSCAWCGALAVKWRCSNCEGEKLRLIGSGATRTAEDLGRAFPGVRVIIADGERPILQVDERPALVIATRGAEPIAAGGYRAVLLLDGETLVARESLRVGEDCLRSWSNAAALAAHRAPVMLVRVGRSLATALATWRQADYAKAELVDRRHLRFPPAVRVASITGSPQAVADAAAAVPVDPSDILGPVEIADGHVRTIVRFDYAKGAEVAAALRAELVRNATGRRRPPKGEHRVVRQTLRVRFDDSEPFLDS
jgi:primosomal protein N' (replication factor Y)